MLRIGAAIVILAALAAVVGPLLTPFDPAAQDLALRLAGPSSGHLLGLDELGRDILARVLAGARISFLVGLTVVSVSASVGTVLGAVAGYFGGVTDDVISRCIDVLLAFPGTAARHRARRRARPEPRQRVVRADDHRLGGVRASGARASAARAGVRVRAGGPRRRRQDRPDSLATLGMAGAIIGEAALSFLGLGVQPPTPSWGTMLNGGRAHLLDAPHLTIFPGLAIALLVLGVNFLGDGLRDATDPKSN